jgi:hypothetical protein
MPDISGITKWSIAALLLSPAYLAGCEDPTADEVVVDDVDDIVDVEEETEEPADENLRAWTGYTSEETPPLICPNRYAVRGTDCSGDYCDNIALDCRYTARGAGEHSWLPYFSEEGSGTANESHCVGNNMWMTGLTCRGSYCDDLSIRCSALLGSTTGSCTWSDWYSEEQAPFSAPAGRYVKGVECGGSYCDNKRYRYCYLY